MLATGARDRTVRLWDLHTLQPLATLQTLGSDNSLEYRQLVVQKLYRQYLKRPPDPGGLTHGAAFLAANGTADQLAADLAGSQEYFQVRGRGTNDGFLTALYQDVQKQPIDSSSRAHFTQRMANGTTRMQVASMILGTKEDSWVPSVAFSGQGNVLAVGLYNQMVKLYAPITAKELMSLPDPEERTGAEVVFAPRGKLLVTGHSLGTVRLWDLGTWMPPMPAGKENAVPSVPTSPDLVTGTSPPPVPKPMPGVRSPWNRKPRFARTQACGAWRSARTKRPWPRDLRTVASWSGM